MSNSISELIRLEQHQHETGLTGEALKASFNALQTTPDGEKALWSGDHMALERFCKRCHSAINEAREYHNEINSDRPDKQKPLLLGDGWDQEPSRMVKTMPSCKTANPATLSYLRNHTFSGRGVES